MVDAKKKRSEACVDPIHFVVFFSRPSSGLWQDLLIKMRLWKFSCLTTTNTCPTGRQALIEAVSEGDGWGQEGAHTSTCNVVQKPPFVPLGRELWSCL